MKRSMKVMHHVIVLSVSAAFKSHTHHEIPKQKVDRWSHEFAYNRLAKDVEKIKRLKVGKNGRGK